MAKPNDRPRMFTPIIKAISHALAAMDKMQERLHGLKIAKALREHDVHKAADLWRERSVDPSIQASTVLLMDQDGLIHQPPAEMGDNSNEIQSLPLALHEIVGHFARPAKGNHVSSENQTLAIELLAAMRAQMEAQEIHRAVGIQTSNPAAAKNRL